jgi:hypothetical protein
LAFVPVVSRSTTTKVTSRSGVPSSSKVAWYADALMLTGQRLAGDTDTLVRAPPSRG